MADERDVQDAGTNNGTAVQVRKRRHDGWTAARRALFFRTLAETANVRLSAEAAGVSATSAYDLRRRDPGFAETWEAAKAEGMQTLELSLMERAIRGDPRPVMFGGERKDEIRVYPDKVAMYLMTRHDNRVLRGGADDPGDGGAAGSLDRLRALRARQQETREKLAAVLDEIDAGTVGMNAGTAGMNAGTAAGPGAPGGARSGGGFSDGGD